MNSLFAMKGKRANCNIKVPSGGASLQTNFDALAVVYPCEILHTTTDAKSSITSRTSKSNLVPFHLFSVGEPGR